MDKPLVQSTRNCTTAASTGRVELKRLEILGESATVTITVWPLERAIGMSYLRQVWRGEVSLHLEDEIVSDLETVVSELAPMPWCTLMVSVSFESSEAQVPWCSAKSPMPTTILN
ncbi:hypothetical protein ABZ806_40170 [Spirillospora sp. NPDC047418]